MKLAKIIFIMLLCVPLFYLWICCLSNLLDEVLKGKK